MADHVSPEKRSYIMAKVRNKDTWPELAVRKALHNLGYRYRINRRDLPGSPDIVFPSRRKAIFVHGCFWHGHGCRWGRLPKTKIEYWSLKIKSNGLRDIRKMSELAERGWSGFVVWQCDLRDFENTLKKILAFLENK